MGGRYHSPVRRPPRIVVLVANPITYDGRVRRHASTLVEAGYDVTVIGVIGPNDRADPPIGVGAPTTSGGTGSPPWHYQRIDRRRVGIVPRLRWLQSAARQRLAHAAFLGLSRWLPNELSRSPAALAQVQLAGLSVATSAPELAFAALRQRPQLIYANDLDTLPAAAWAAAILRVPFVYDAHEVYVDEYPELGAEQRQARACVEAHFVGQAAAVLTVNQLLATDLSERYRLPLPSVVRNLPQNLPCESLRPPVQRPLGDEGSLRLLYHGAHIGLSQHGVDDLLRALQRLRQPGPGQLQVVLTLRGGLLPDEERALRARIDSLGLQAAVHIAPPVPGAEALVSAAVADGAEVGLAVHPPLCLSYVYTTSSKVYEYQLAGLAVCASDVLGNRHSVAPQAGVFYVAGDDAGLADCLRPLARDRQLLRRMQQSAYEHAVRHLRWQDEKQPLLQTVARSLAGSPLTSAAAAGLR